MVNYKHGFAKIADRNKSNPAWRTHYRWLDMKARCDNPNYKQYKDYGGRGITYDPGWAEFELFVEDMGLAPEGRTLDRIDNNGNYCKSNCRWATRIQQGRNKSNNRHLEFNGKNMCISEWAEYLGVEPRLLRVRLNRGWSVERTLTEGF